MTVILLDLGNTALKWAPLGEDENPRTFVHGGSDVLPEEVFDEWLALNPERVIGCMVSSENLALTLTKFFNEHRISWEWMHSQPVFKGPFTLRNGYDDFKQLGSDRWYAAIGAASLYPGEALVVMHAGTATTIDTVLPCEDGALEFKGGRILPGPVMMYRSLVKNTRCRPLGIGRHALFQATRRTPFLAAFLRRTLASSTARLKRCVVRALKGGSCLRAARRRFWRPSWSRSFRAPFSSTTWCCAGSGCLQAT